MAYKTWSIGGITPSWVEPTFTDDPENRTLTLRCAAIADELGDDPITEIDSLQAISSQNINNEQLLAGGSKLQVGRGDNIITVVAVSGDGSDIRTWQRCALKKVKVDLDSYYLEEAEGSHIEYELVIIYETDSPGGSFVYTPDYDKYPNADYYFWYNPVTEEKTAWGGQNVGTELGYMEITEAQNVIRVEVYGCGDGVGDDYYIECNGEKQYWHYGETIEDNVPLLEKFIFNLDSPTTTVILNSGMHVEGGANFGCYLAWVRVVYE